MLIDTLFVIPQVELQDISDDELSLVNATENAIQLQHNNDLFSEISETDSVHELPPLSDPTTTRTKSHARRSMTARTRRNSKRNRIHRLTRYRHRLIRTVYHRFTMDRIKRILKHLR